jgi:hypothetical protein
MKDPPCRNCLLLAVCKSRFMNYTNVSSFAYDTKCPLACEYIENYGMEEVNEMRKIFGLKKIK